jgi:membrane protein YqaA with SNARE-associated domain
MTPEDLSAPSGRRQAVWKAVAQTAAGVLVLLGGMALLSRYLRGPLESFGHFFVEHFGVAGMALGTFLCDGFHIPPPPQVYFVAAITAHLSPVPVLAATGAASMAAGVVGYHVASRLSNLRVFHGPLERTRPRVDALFARWGAWAMAVGSVTPLPYAWLCWFAGIYRVRPRHFLVLILLRVPRLAVMYWLVAKGWSSGAPGP